MPARTSQITQVGKRKVELSNLTKVLFPDDRIVKAQLIEYYLKIAPTILSHVKGRPLSLVRYPDGIGGESFFQKNRPDWAPDWIEHVTLGEEKKDYESTRLNSSHTVISYAVFCLKKKKKQQLCSHLTHHITSSYE